MVTYPANISCRWFHESSRWLVLSNKSEQAIKNLKSVAKFNGRCEEGEKINIKVSRAWCVTASFTLSDPFDLRAACLCAQMLQESMKKEMSGSQGSYSFLDLFRTTTMRTMTVCLSAVWYVSCTHPRKTQVATFTLLT